MWTCCISTRPDLDESDHLLCQVHTSVFKAAMLQIACLSAVVDKLAETKPKSTVFTRGCTNKEPLFTAASRHTQTQAPDWNTGAGGLLLATWRWKMLRKPLVNICLQLSRRHRHDGTCRSAAGPSPDVHRRQTSTTSSDTAMGVSKLKTMDDLGGPSFATTLYWLFIKGYFQTTQQMQASWKCDAEVGFWFDTWLKVR